MFNNLGNSVFQKYISIGVPSRSRAIKILSISNYLLLFLDIVQGLFLIPLYIKYIGVNLYGLWLATGGILSSIAFLDLGISSLIVQRLSREFAQKKFDSFSKYFTNGLIVNIVLIALIFFIGITLTSTSISFRDKIFNNNHVLISAFNYSLFALIFSLFFNSIEGVFNSLQIPLVPKIFQILGSLIGLVLLLSILMGDTPLLAIPINNLVRSSVSLFPSLILLVFIFKKNNLNLIKYDVAIVKEYFQILPSLVLSKFGSTFANNIEPILIGYFISPQVTVWFTVTKKGGEILKMVFDRLSGIIYPSLGHLYNEKSNIHFNIFFASLIKVVFIGVCCCFLLYFYINKFFVQLWIGSDSYIGDLTTFFIALALCSSFFSNFLSYLLGSVGDIKYTSYFIFIESFLKIVLMILLVYLIGLNGLPIATIIASFIFILLFYKRWLSILNTKYLFRFNNFHPLKIFLLISTLVVMYCFRGFFEGSLFHNIAYSSFCVCILLLITYKPIILSKNILIKHI
jgi:O-antigen/teichoic acid export membrane protein